MFTSSGLNKMHEFIPGSIWCHKENKDVRIRIDNFSYNDKIVNFTYIETPLYINLIGFQSYENYIFFLRKYEPVYVVEGFEV